MVYLGVYAKTYTQYTIFCYLKICKNCYQILQKQLTNKGFGCRIGIVRLIDYLERKMNYAKQVNRMSVYDKMDAETQGKIFAKEVEKDFVNVEKVYRNGYCIVMNCDDGDEAGADVVRCPHCNEIQVCWGQYGDPETEIAICNKCGENYQTEPF